VTVDLRARLAELAALQHPTAPVVSVYLTTRWADEHQRDRVRVFLKHELARARATAAPALGPDLDWIESEGAALIEQSTLADAHGVALFACATLGLREVHAVRAPFADTFIVADRPHLRPLADGLEDCPEAVVAFVDAETARLIPLGPAGPRDEVTLTHEVSGHHRQGGWALLAQSRYARHLQVQRDRHLEAVAEALAALTGAGTARLVIAGEARVRAALRRHLAPALDACVVGELTGSRHEPAGALAARAMAVIAQAGRAETAAAVDEALVEAAKGGRAVAGLAATLEAVAAGAVRRLFLQRSFTAPGAVCGHCGVMQSGHPAACPLCGHAPHRVELGEAMVERVLETGGVVDVVDGHAGLAARGGVAARVRYAPNGRTP
jgi:peptide subunit release factor 1 (eRF1)